jgi:hypothetical protein
VNGRELPADDNDVLGVGALGVHRIGSDDDAAQVDPVQQQGFGIVVGCPVRGVSI